jgi:hypothetical protein
MAISAANQQFLRTHPQDLDVFLTVFQPQPIFKAVVGTVTSSQGLLQIPYTSVSFGGIGRVETDMIMLVGTTEGSQDVGRLRVRRTGGGNLFVEEHSLTISTGLHLTVLKYVEIRPVYPRMIQDEDNLEDVIWYKDYDIEYTGQNTMLGTFVCMGPHRAANLANGTASLYWSSEGTSNLIGEALTYAWEFEGGTPSSGTTATPGLVSYDSPGNYVTKLTVNGSSGTSDVGYRYVRIHDPIGVGSDIPIVGLTEWGAVSHGIDEAGFTYTFTISQPVPYDYVREGSVVIVYGQTKYGGTVRDIGANATNNNSTLFVGYVLDGSVVYDWEFGTVQFKVGSPTQVMKGKTVFGSVSLEAKQNPRDWYEFSNSLLTGKTAVGHYYKWHSTVLKLCDFEWEGPDYRIQYFDTPNKANLYDAIDNFLRDTYVSKLVCDRQGKLWVDADGKTYGNPAVFTDQMTISKGDWIGTPVITRKLTKPLSWLEIGGVIFNGLTTSTPVMSAAPSLVPDPNGRERREQGLSVDSQSRLNILAGAIWSNENYEFPTIQMDMAGAYWPIDVAPLQAYRMNILPEDTPQNVAITGTYYPSRISYNYDADQAQMMCSITWNALTKGVVGSTIVIPVPPDPIVIDVNNPEPEPEPTPPLPVLYPKLIVVQDVFRGLWGLEFPPLEEGVYDWVELTGRLTETEVASLVYWHIQLYGGGQNLDAVGQFDGNYYHGNFPDGLYKRYDADAFRQVLELPDGTTIVPRALTVHPYSGSGVILIKDVINQPYGGISSVILTNGSISSPAEVVGYDIGRGSDCSYGDSGRLYIQRVAPSTAASKITSDDGGLTYSPEADFPIGATEFHNFTRGGYHNDKMIWWRNPTDVLFRSDDGGETSDYVLTLSGTVTPVQRTALAVSDSGEIAFVNGLNVINYSPDFGDNWIVKPGPAGVVLGGPIGIAWFGVNGVGGWVLMSNGNLDGAAVFVSTDGMVTWSDITGNLMSNLRAKTPTNVTLNLDIIRLVYQ